MIDTLTIDLGDGAKLDMTFSVDDVDTDPATITIELKSPSNAVTTYTFAASQITKIATGQYRKILGASILNAAGQWRYSWIGTGTAEGAEQGLIVVNARASA